MPDVREIVVGETEDGGSVILLNQSDVGGDELELALRSNREIAELTKWVRSTRSPGDSLRRAGGLFERDRFVTPRRIFDQFQMCYDAADADDIVGAFLETTEGLAFGAMEIETTDEDQQDILNQIVEEIDVDTRMREIWREMAIISNVYLATWWGRRSFKVRGKTEAGQAKRREFTNLEVPLGLTVLDPLKILPAGNFLFGRERLLYTADWTETDVIDAHLAGKADPEADQIVAQLITGRYTPNLRDRRAFGELGFDANHLYELNPRLVWRITATRSSYQRFATPRMISILELLDLKHQLRQKDRAHLIGATNFIVVVRKGTDALPADPKEIAALQNQARFMARVPMMVGDHRLSVDIVTPATDDTLDPAKYLGLDLRIAARLYGMFMPGNQKDDSTKLARMISRGLQSRRDQQRRSFGRHVLEEIRRRNPDHFTDPSHLVFYPKRIALEFDPALAQYLLDLRDRGDLSRDSVLSEVDYDQLDEWRKRKLEKRRFDDDFMPAVLPPGSPGVGPGTAGGPQDPKAAGRRLGGNRNGGGAAPGSGQGQAPTRPTRPRSGKTGTSNPRRAAAADENETEFAATDDEGTEPTFEDGSDSDGSEPMEET